MNGKVVVIDDEVEKEAIPLIEALAHRGIPVRFYRGRVASLPVRPLGMVRILFLDMKLEGVDFSLDSDDIAKSLKGVVDRIIGPENGPYILIGWTKTPRHLKVLQNLLDNKPILVLDLKKNDCFINGQCDIIKIEENLAGVLTKLGPLKLLFHWENLVNHSSGEVIQRFVSLVDGATQEDNLRQAFYRMSMASVGKNVSELDEEGLVRNTLGMLNTALADGVDHLITTDSIPTGLALNRSSDIFSITSGEDRYIISKSDQSFVVSRNDTKILTSKKNQTLEDFAAEMEDRNKDEQIIAALHTLNGTQKKDLVSLSRKNPNGNSRAEKELIAVLTKEKCLIFDLLERYQLTAARFNRNLFFAMNPQQAVRPGNVYTRTFEDIRSKLEQIKTIFKSDDIDVLGGLQIRDFEILDLEISPPCDYAQQKNWKHPKLVSGCLFPAKHTPRLIEPKALYIYTVPPFEFQGKVCKAVFDFRYLSTPSFGSINPLRLIFRLKKELLADILSQFSSYIGRPGVVSLD